MTTDQKKLFGSAAAGLFAVIVAASVLSAYLWDRLPGMPRAGLYAVFLANGQVYFGNITSETGKEIVLKGIYYIQMKGDAKQGLDAQSDVSLLKLGNELHGPEDWMEINRSQVLFIEKLKTDGKVAKAIASYDQK